MHTYCKILQYNTHRSLRGYTVPLYTFDLYYGIWRFLVRFIQNASKNNKNVFSPGFIPAMSRTASPPLLCCPQPRESSVMK